MSRLDFKLLNQKMVTTRKEHGCFYCDGRIAKGEECLSEACLYENVPYRLYVCRICLKKADEDD